MNILLARFFSTSEETIGGMFIDGTFSAFTLEDERREVKVMAETRIPEGDYQLTLRAYGKHFEKYGHPMIEVKGVPGFTDILIHKGNTEKHTAGCILVGNTMIYKPNNPFFLAESGLAYDRIYPIVAEAIELDGVLLSIRDFWKTAFV